MPLFIYLFLLIQLSIISYLDLKWRRISNLWPLFNLVISIILFILFPKTYQFNWETFVYSFVFFWVGFIIYVLKIMGGGDSKYLASFFLLIPIPYQDPYLTILLSTTIIVGVYFLILNTSRGWNTVKHAFLTGQLQLLKNVYGRKFPFAPIILLSWLILGVWDFVIK